jgi:starch-binding outer membrane protein, SusD/RagB family
MKANIKNLITVTGLALALFTVSSCSKLEPELGGNESIAPPLKDGAPTPPTISSVYGQLNQLIGQEFWYAMQEHSTDELLGPTRGTDWDDFGTWRRLHLHTWGPDHNQINTLWNQLNGALFQTTLAAELLSGQAQAEGKFLRSYFRFLVIDNFGQMQTRPATAPSRSIPNVVPRSAAIDSIITELESAVALLPSYTSANNNLATKEAAWFLLAKLYLNKAVYKQSSASPAGPFTFVAADMNKVIQYCNNIDANPALQIDNNYWDNFKWDNGTVSSENIFVRRNSDGINMRWQTSMGGHYNQTPDGWNGFTTLSNFYDAFEDGDVRKSSSIPGFTNETGVKAGFQIGQVQGPVSPDPNRKAGRIGDPIGNLVDRSGNPLIFVRNVSPFFNSEANGIRTIKFPLNPSTINDGGWGSANDFPFFRFADVRLMKAEAILRGGADAETPLAIVNDIRTNRAGTTALTSLDLAGLLAERGRELYLEGWRRNDLIRFSAFNKPTQARTSASTPNKVIYPIPTIALSSNPNLKQNEGY